AAGVVRGPAVWHPAESPGAQGPGDRRPPGAAADAARQRPGQGPLGCGEHAGLGRPGTAAEDPVRGSAGDASGAPLPPVGQDLLQGPPTRFLKRFLMRPAGVLCVLRTLIASGAGRIIRSSATEDSRCTIVGSRRELPLSSCRPWLAPGTSPSWRTRPSG